MADNYSKGSIYQLDLTSLRPDPAQASKTAALMHRLESLQGELANLAWQGLTEGEKQELTNRLQDLKQGADALLQAMGPVPL